MPPEAKKMLVDILEAADLVFVFLLQRTRSDFESDVQLRSAVQWQLVIVGEAMTRLRRSYPHVAARVSEYGKIIAFRNQILHGYDAIRNAITWKVIEEKLPVLREEVLALLAEPDTE